MSEKYPAPYTSTTLMCLMSSIQYGAIGLAVEHRMSAFGPSIIRPILLLRSTRYNSFYFSNFVSDLHWDVFLYVFGCDFRVFWLLHLHFSSLAFSFLHLHFPHFMLIYLMELVILDRNIWCSYGDDGHIRGWRWKDCIESMLPVPLQGIESYLCIWYLCKLTENLSY